MAKIVSFTFALGITPNPQNAQNLLINTPIQIIVAPYIPSTFSFTLLLGIRDFDVSKSHSLRVTLRNARESAKPLFTSQVQVPPVPKNDEVNLPDEFLGFMTCLTFQNVVLKNEGIYTASIFFDEEKLNDMDIYVARKKEDDDK